MFTWVEAIILAPDAYEEPILVYTVPPIWDREVGAGPNASRQFLSLGNRILIV